MRKHKHYTIVALVCTAVLLAPMVILLWPPPSEAVATTGGNRLDQLEKRIDALAATIEKLAMSPAHHAAAPPQPQTPLGNPLSARGAAPPPQTDVGDLDTKSIATSVSTKQTAASKHLASKQLASGTSIATGQPTDSSPTSSNLVVSRIDETDGTATRTGAANSTDVTSTEADERLETANAGANASPVRKLPGVGAPKSAASIRNATSETKGKPRGQTARNENVAPATTQMQTGDVNQDRNQADVEGQLGKVLTALNPADKKEVKPDFEVVVMRPGGPHVRQSENVLLATKQAGWPVVVVRSEIEGDRWWVQQLVTRQGAYIASQTKFGNEQTVPGLKFELVLLLLDTAEEAVRFRTARQFDELPAGIRRSQPVHFTRH